MQYRAYLVGGVNGVEGEHVNLRCGLYIDLNIDISI